MACPVFDDTNARPKPAPAIAPAADPDPAKEAQMLENKSKSVEIRIPTKEEMTIVPVSQQPPVQQLARQGLRFFIPHKQLGSYLQQHCAICGQWTATNKVMKLHYRNTHGDIFQKLEKPAGRLIERCATPSLRCLYCDCRHQDWRAHIYKCTTIWQCAILCTLQDPEHDSLRGARPGHGGVLRPRRKEPGSPDSRTGGHAPEAAQGSGEHSIQMVRVGSGRLGLRTSLRPTPELKQGSIASFCRTSHAASRRGTEATTTGHQHGAMVQPRPRFGADALVSNSGCFQEAAAGRTHLGAGACAPEAGHGYSHVPSPQGTPSPGAEHARPAEESGGYGMEGQSGVGVPGLEPPTPPPGTRSKQAAHLGNRDDQQARVFHHSPQAGCCPSVPLHPPPHGEHGLQSDFSSGPLSEEQTCGGNLGPDGGTTGVLCIPVDRAGLQEGEARQGPGGSEDPRHDQIAVRRVFVNRGNHCYMNSLVQLLTWALHLSGAETLAMGQGALFFDQLREQKLPVDLLQVPGWQAIIAEWTEAHRQHDVCEFLQYVLTFMNAPLFQGEWQARQLVSQTGNVRCVDRGQGTQALALHFPRLPPGLSTELEVQHMVDHWHKVMRIFGGQGGKLKRINSSFFHHFGHHLTLRFFIIPLIILQTVFVFSSFLVAAGFCSFPCHFLHFPDL